MSGRWNTRNAGVKRIQQELREISREDDPDILAQAIEDNIFEWHFVIRGAWDSEFEGGIYHGRILMPAEYPFKPPAFVMLTPSGRFETGVKICLSISSHHPESWQPSWSVRSALVALIAFMQTPGNGALGSLDHPTEARRQMAAESRVLPPRFGTEERRELIAAMHQRMLELEPRSRAVCCQERVADAGPEAAEAAASAQAPPPASPQAEVQSGQQQPPLQEPAQQQPQQQQQQQQPADVVPLVPAARPAVVPAAPEPAPVPVPAAPSTPAEPELRQRAAAAAASPVAPPTAAAQEAAPAELPQPEYRHGNATSWEDRGLTYLAVLLALCIAALLARKVLVAFTFNSDDLFNFNHVEGVEL